LTSDAQASASTRPFLILLGPLLGGFIGMFSEVALNIALPDLMHVFGITAATAQWLTTAYLLVVAVLLPMSSLLMRWFTTRQLVFTVLIAFTIGAVISGMASGFGMLLVGRLFQGIGTGMLIPVILSTAAAAYPPARRGHAMGMVGLVLMFAPAVSPTIAGLVMQTIGWQWIFWVQLPIIAVAAVIALVFLRNMQPISRPHVDVLSVAACTVGLGLFVFGVSSAGTLGPTSPILWVCIVGGLAILAGFVHRQLHLDEPVLNVRIFAHRNFTLATFMILANQALMMCAIFLIPMYLERGRSVEVFITGLIMLPAGVVNGVISVWAGHASDVHRPWVLARIGFALSVVASVLFLTMGNDSALWLLIAFNCLLMIGVPLTMTPAQTHGLNALPGALGADGATAIASLQQVGGAIGTAFAAALLSAGTMAAEGMGINQAAATVFGVREGFVFSIVLGVVGLVLGLLMRGQHGAHSSSGTQHEAGAAVAEPSLDQELATVAAQR